MSWALFSASAFSGVERNYVSLCAGAGRIQRNAANDAAPDAPLGDDDRTGLRVSIPIRQMRRTRDRISGLILPRIRWRFRPRPPGVTGVFAAQVVAVDAVSGRSLSERRSAGGVARLQVLRNLMAPMKSTVWQWDTSYTVYAEALNGAVDPRSSITRLLAMPQYSERCRLAAAEGCVCPLRISASRLGRGPDPEAEFLSS